MNAHNLQGSGQASGQLQHLVQDSCKQIGRHGDPNLLFQRIDARFIVSSPARRAEFDQSAHSEGHG